MNRIQEIKHWLEEGNLYRAEKAIKDCTTDILPEEKEEFEQLLNEISVRHYQLLAGKAILSKDESLLSICIQKLSEKNGSVSGLKAALYQIKSEKRHKLYTKALIIIFAAIAVLFLTLLLFV